MSKTTVEILSKHLYEYEFKKAAQCLDNTVDSRVHKLVLEMAEYYGNIGWKIDDLDCEQISYKIDAIMAIQPNIVA